MFLISNNSPELFAIHRLIRSLTETPNLERHLTACFERVERFYSKNKYQLREALFDELDSFGITHTDKQKLFNNIEISDFESIRLKDRNFTNTETATSIVKHLPISVSFSSNSIQVNIFLSNPNTHDLVSSLIDVLESLTKQTEAQMKLNFLHIETTKKSRNALVLEVRNECRNHCVGSQIEENDSEIKSTRFLQLQKFKFIHSQEHLERYCNILTIIGFHSASYDIGLSKS